MTVRVFAGWEFNEQDVQRADFAEHGYAHGVPMGGDLKKAKKGQAPSLLIRALRDPDGANIDRIQVIKGWLDKKGKAQERIYDVACAGNRVIKNRRCDKPVGNTVNVAQASYTNTIGAPLLLAHRKDPAFDRKQQAFYYVRVLEIPTPRWPAYDAKIFGVKIPKDIVMQHQERAYTSAIWYTP